MSNALQILVYGVINGALYALVAMGLALVFGVMNYLNVAHGAWIILGSYVTFLLFGKIGLDPFLSLTVSGPIFFLIGLILFQSLYGALYRQIEHEKIKNSLLISFGVLLLVPNIIILIWTADERAITTFYSGRTLDLAGVRLPYTGLGTILMAIVVFYVLHLLLSRTYFGKSVRAVAQDYEAAGLMGINIRKTYLLSFGLGLALSVFPAILVSLTTFNPEFSFELTNKALVVVVLAGVGTVSGVLVAGLLLGVVEAAAVFFTGAAYRDLIGLALFVVVLLLRPQGLMGRKHD